MGLAACLQQSRRGLQPCGGPLTGWGGGRTGARERDCWGDRAAPGSPCPGGGRRMGPEGGAPGPTVPICLSPVPRRRADALGPAQREAEGLRGLQPQDQRPLPAEGAGQVLARGLPQVRLLRLPPGRGGLHPVHQGQPHPVPARLPEVGPPPPPLPSVPPPAQGGAAPPTPARAPPLGPSARPTPDGPRCPWAPEKLPRAGVCRFPESRKGPPRRGLQEQGGGKP